MQVLLEPHSENNDVTAENMKKFAQNDVTFQDELAVKCSACILINSFEWFWARKALNCLKNEAKNFGFDKFTKFALSHLDLKHNEQASYFKEFNL